MFEPARQHRNGAAGEGALVGAGVEPAREAGDDDETGFTEISREPFGKQKRAARRLA